MGVSACSASGIALRAGRLNFVLLSRQVLHHSRPAGLEGRQCLAGVSVPHASQVRDNPNRPQLRTKAR